MHERNIVNIEIINRGNRFSLLGETGSSYIDPSVRRHWDDLKVKLDEGAPLRLLIVNPFCKSKRLRNELNGVTTKLDPKLKLEIIYNLYRKYPNVDVKFTDEIYCSIFFSEREMMYDPYHLGKVADRLENYFLAFHFEDRNASPGSFSYYKILKNHFEILWTKAIDLETFIDMYRSHLQEAGLESIVTLSQT